MRKSFFERILKKLIPVILVVMLCWSHTNMLTTNVVYADSSTDTFQNYDILPFISKYSAGYFRRLTNFGRNLHGSCGYVAIGMLLSFYDTYWSDLIIPERFDNNYRIPSGHLDASYYSNYQSPGIYREHESDIDPLLDYNEYVNKILEFTGDQTKDTYFHLKLLRLAEILGYWDSDDGEKNDGGGGDGFGLSDYEAKSFLEDYFSSYINKSGVEVDYVVTNVRSYVIQCIMNGKPVYLGLDGLNSSHAVVAYDYDANNDEIYVHTGWDGYPRVKLSELMEAEGYLWCSGAISLSFDNTFPHSCSNNYYYFGSTGDEVYVCPCDLPFHPAHEHLNTTYSSTKHIVDCFCGEYGELIDHDFIYTRTSNTRHEITCYGCDYYSSANHSVRGGLGGGTAACIYCGAIVNIGDGFIQMGLTPGVGEIMSDGSRIVTANGSCILPSGVLVLSEADYLLVLKGELDPHALLHDHGQQTQ